MKRLKTLLAASAAFLAVAGTAQAQQQIEWWDFLVGGDGVRMKALIQDFNEAHPDIQINSTSLEWGTPFYTKVRTAAAVGQGPDIVTYHLSRIPLGLSEGVLTEITDTDLQNADLATSDFFERSVEAATQDGKLYAVPFDIHAIVLYYNADLLEGSEYLDENGRLTGIDGIEDFEAAMAYATENKGADVGVSYATGDDGGTWRVFYTLLSQQGGELIADGQILPGDNAAKAERAIEIMTRWQENGWGAEQAEYEASVALFTSGRSVFHMNGVWEVPTFTDLAKRDALGFEWAAVQVPALLDTEATWADSHAFAIPIQGDETMPEEKRAAVMEVIGWMERNSLRWADAGHIPAYKPVAESEEYRSMEPNATYASLVGTASYDPRSTVAGVASPVYDAAINIISPAIHGMLSPADAVEEIKLQLQPLLK